MTSTKAAGRPRDAAIDEAILLATWEELNRVGYTSLTMIAVAEGAGIQKPALYRRWSTKSLLVIDTLARHLPALASVDRGSLRADLEHIVSQLAEAWRTPATRWSLSPLLADVSKDEAARVALRERLLQPRGRALRDALDRAISRGELRDNAPLEVVADMLEGPLMHRMMFGSGVLDQQLLDTIHAGCLTLLGAATADDYRYPARGD